MADKRPALLVFRELTEDDKQKLKGEAKYAESGGGARDFRFNYDAFKGVFARMLPERENRGDRTKYVGELTEPVDSDNPGGETTTHELKFWPPTPSRPAEGRVAQVHKYVSFTNYPKEVDGRTFLLIIQTRSGEVRAHYTTEEDLRTNKDWNLEVRKTILDCTLGNAERGNAIMGWIDFINGRSYCHE